jgi:hypothetical protein
MGAKFLLEDAIGEEIVLESYISRPENHIDGELSQADKLISLSRIVNRNYKKLCNDDDIDLENNIVYLSDKNELYILMEKLHNYLSSVYSYFETVFSVITEIKGREFNKSPLDMKSSSQQDFKCNFNKFLLGIMVLRTTAQHAGFDGIIWNKCGEHKDRISYKIEFDVQSIFGSKVLRQDKHSKHKSTYYGNNRFSISQKGPLNYIRVFHQKFLEKAKEIQNWFHLI